MRDRTAATIRAEREKIGDHVEKLRAKMKQDASWDAYKAGLMERINKRKWPVNKLMVRQMAGGRSLIRTDPPPGMLGAVVRSNASGLPRTDIDD